MRSLFDISVSLQFNILNEYEQPHAINNFFNNFENLFGVKHTANILHYFFVNFEIKLRLNSLQFLRDHSAYLLCDFSETTLTIPSRNVSSYLKSIIKTLETFPRTLDLVLLLFTLERHLTNFHARGFDVFLVDFSCIFSLGCL